MMKFTPSYVFAGLLLVPPVFATQQTVTLDVRGMTCAACPITVKRALTNVAGVSRADVRYEKRQVVVTFDDTLATIEKLTHATADAGFPSVARREQ